MIYDLHTELTRSRTEAEYRTTRGRPMKRYHLYYLGRFNQSLGYEEVYVDAPSPAEAMTEAMSEHGGYFGARHMRFDAKDHPELVDWKQREAA